MIKAVIFDIDTTLTYEVSWYFLTEKLGADVESHKCIFSNFLENKINYKEAKSQLISLWKKTGNADKVNLKEIFSTVRLKDDAQELVNYLKSKNIAICLITGSVDLYAQTIANRLDVEHYYANTKLVWNDKEELVDFDYEKDQGKKKVNQLNDFCLKSGLNHSEVCAIGDDENDIELFKLTHHGIAVKSNSSYKVEPYAWKVIDALLEIKEIII